MEKNGRLLAYTAPWFSGTPSDPLPPRDHPDRRTFNLDMVALGWAATFVIYPSIPRPADLNLLIDEAETAWQEQRGAWAQFGQDLLLGYEYRACIKNVVALGLVRELGDHRAEHGDPAVERGVLLFELLDALERVGQSLSQGLNVGRGRPAPGGGLELQDEFGVVLIEAMTGQASLDRERGDGEFAVAALRGAVQESSGGLAQSPLLVFVSGMAVNGPHGCSLSSGRWWPAAWWFRARRGLAGVRRSVLGLAGAAVQECPGSSDRLGDQGAGVGQGGDAVLA
ncbi:hypothetical protein [Nonomuraea basaltis]|uniref:hypothetical protein n=1 Tax=Nonomuraea basaltis TaxID=2495887 RepID=UPI00197DBA65|nr:hypothetical protein [Nonomuraea basaltis]